MSLFTHEKKIIIIIDKHEESEKKICNPKGKQKKMKSDFHFKKKINFFFGCSCFFFLRIVSFFPPNKFSLILFSLVSIRSSHKWVSIRKCNEWLIKDIQLISFPQVSKLEPIKARWHYEWNKGERQLSVKCNKRYNQKASGKLYLLSLQYPSTPVSHGEVWMGLLC